ncbi:ABC transporter permease [Clostridium aestuarii]|uniref:ABC transporter permease n=1 Tax=Clostridium aestuarii TaxID=338193 RepID=A0ABT4CWM7_9CLOT|nr:ABC transporter permease [Clostridium aestuarii]MCY6483396.1 ABC transporter permease [Clostridium aestuarii]
MKKYAAYPYIIWSIIFIIVPLVLVVVFSLTKYQDGLVFTLDNFKRLMKPMYGDVFIHSILLALIATIASLILGYPMAMILANIELKKRSTMVLLFVLPMWMNFLLRTYAWMSILGRNGFINVALKALGLPTFNLLYNDGAVILGMVYNFLPFMVLPIYTVLSKMDKKLIEAAKDLGANKIIVFIKIILPLSIPGVMSGITMVFMPAVSTFVIPRLLGGGQYMLIGNLVEDQFTLMNDWHFGSAVSIIMMILILISMAAMSKYDKEESGGHLW